MNQVTEARRILRDNVATELRAEIEVLIDRIICLDTGGELSIGHISESAQKELDSCCYALQQIEAALDELRGESPDTDVAHSLLVEAAKALVVRQRDLQQSLIDLLHDLEQESVAEPTNA